MSALSLTHVQKVFKTGSGDPFTAVDDVSFSVKEGSIHGLLGPNGAGKSTLINMISGVLTPTAGKIELCGIDVAEHAVEAKRLLGVVPQEIVIEMAFTVEEVLYYFCGMYGVPLSERSARITEVLEDFDLTSKRKERARGLSGGMKRRLMIAKALLHRPKLLILDEPTAGVDVALRQRIWEVVRRLNQQGMTIVFTTHYLEEAEQLCEAITLIHKGNIIKEGSIKSLQQEFSQNLIRFSLYDPSAPTLEGVVKIGTDYQYPMTDLSLDLRRITDHYGSNIKQIQNEKASLEEIFLTLTK
ncbi:ABC transporter ATP-binding protein [Patescibacteria group bacterium]|nr:ABC transporter ATP-binding protein [Patescibacteria group bacterium]